MDSTEGKSSSLLYNNNNSLVSLMWKSLLSSPHHSLKKKNVSKVIRSFSDSFLSHRLFLFLNSCKFFFNFNTLQHTELKIRRKKFFLCRWHRKVLFHTYTCDDTMMRLCCWLKFTYTSIEPVLYQRS